MPWDHFDFLAPYYDRAIRDFSGKETFERLAGLHGGSRLLDVGGGTGRVAAALRGQLGSVFIADVSPGMLRQARAKDLDAACALSERLPFPAGSFDCVLMVDALHHVLDQRASALEMWRVVRPGGRVIVQEPDIRTFSVKLVALAEKLALMRSHFLSPARIADLFDLPGARTEIEAEGFSAWVVVHKSETA